MADGADDRDLAGENRPRHALIVEAPEILQRAAAAPDDQHVTLFTVVRQLDSADDLSWCVFALYGGRVDHYRQGGIAAFKHMQNIVQRGPGFRGDHPYAVGGGGKRLLALLIEQPLCRQLRLELLVLLLKQTFPCGLHALDDDLIFAARLVERNAGANQNLLSVLGTEGDPTVAVAEHRTAYLGGIILQREVPVTGGRLSKV